MATDEEQSKQKDQLEDQINNWFENWTAALKAQDGENGEFIWKKNYDDLWNDMPDRGSMDSVISIGKYISDNMPDLTEEEGIYYVASVGRWKGKVDMRSQRDFLGKYRKRFVESIRGEMAKRETIKIDKNEFDKLLKEGLISIDEFGFVIKMKSIKSSNDKILSKFQLFDQIKLNGKNEEYIVHKLRYCGYIGLESKGPRKKSIQNINVGRIVRALGGRSPKQGPLSRLSETGFQKMIKLSHTVVRYISHYASVEEISKWKRKEIEKPKVFEYFGVGVAVGNRVIMTAAHPIAPGRRLSNDAGMEAVLFKSELEARDIRLVFLQVIGGGYYGTDERCAYRPLVDAEVLQSQPRFDTSEFSVVTMEDVAKKEGRAICGDVLPVDIAFIVFNESLFGHSVNLPDTLASEELRAPKQIAGIAMPMYEPTGGHEFERVVFAGGAGPLVTCPPLYHHLAGADPFLVGIENAETRRNEMGIHITHDGWTVEGMSGMPLFDASSGQLIGIHTSYDDTTKPVRNIAQFTNSNFISLMVNQIVNPKIEEKENHVKFEILK